MATPGSPNLPTRQGIVRPTFTIARKGYDQAEVMSYVADLEADARASRAETEALRRRSADLEAAVSDLQAQLVAKPSVDIPLDEDIIAAAVGDEMANIIRTARSVAEELRSRATTDAEQMVRSARAEAERTLQSARAEADQTLQSARAEAEQTLQSAHGEAERAVVDARAEAERILQLARAEADRTKEEARVLHAARLDEAARKLAEATAEAEAHGAELRAKLTAEAEQVLARAAADAAAVRAEADRERRLTVEGAQSARERILADLARRRRVATVQIEQLRAGRERLLVSYGIVRRTLEEVNEEFARADAEARSAAEEVGRRLSAELDLDRAEAATPAAEAVAAEAAPPNPMDTLGADEALPAAEELGTPDLVADAEVAPDHVAEATPVEPQSPVSGWPGEEAGAQAAPAEVRGEVPGEGAEAQAAPTEVPAGPAAEAWTAPASEPSVEPAADPTSWAPQGEPPSEAAPWAAPEPEGSAESAPWSNEPAGAPAAEPPPEPPPWDPAAAAPPTEQAQDNPYENSAPHSSPAPDSPPSPGGPAGGETDGGYGAVPPDGGYASPPPAREEPGQAQEPGEGGWTSPSARVDDPADPGDAPSPPSGRVGPRVTWSANSERIFARAAAPVVRLTEPDAGAVAIVRGTGPVLHHGGEASGDDQGRTRVAVLAADERPDDIVEIVDTDQTAEDRPSTPADAVSGLFDRIRAGREEAVAEARRTLETTDDAPAPPMQQAAAEEPGPEPQPHLHLQPQPQPQPQTEARAQTQSRPQTSAAGDAESRAHPAADQARLERRDEALRDVARELTRRLKREFQDEQSELLDRLRQLAGSATVDALLPPLSPRAGRLVTVAEPHLRAAAEAGSTVAAAELPAAHPAVPEVTALADQLAAAVVDPLRRRLDGLVRGLGDEADRDALVEAIGAAYREVKTQRIEQVVADHVCTAYGLGWFTAVPDGTPLRWIASDADGACADCYDNTLAGAVPRGTAFPTGQLLPPAHEGCRCLLAVES